MQLGRTHRAQMRFPIHFTAPDRSRTYIGETINISSNGFSVQVVSDDPLPTIILAGILPTEVAGDAILCKARVVWQGGLAGGTKRASYKITSIAHKSQERLDEIIQESVAGLIRDLQVMDIFENCSQEDLEALLHRARARELPGEATLYDQENATPGLLVILSGGVAPPNEESAFGPGSVIGQWDDPTAPPIPAAAQTLAPTRLLQLPPNLAQELEESFPVLAGALRDALGRPTGAPGDLAESNHRRRLKPNILRELQEIPTLPAIFNAVMDCVEDPESTPRDLSQIIKNDMALTTKVLKTINSALYGFARRISSVDEAVVLLGMGQTANLATTAMLLNTLVDPARPNDRPETLWEHSLGSAYMAQALGEALKEKNAPCLQWAATRTAGERTPSGAQLQPSSQPDEEISTSSGLTIPLERLFTLAVVHDIGIVALFLKFPDHYAEVRRGVADHGSFHRAELGLLEVDHCQLGYRIAQAWRLPEPMPTVIAEHHLPQIWAQDISDRDRILELLREDPIVTLISLADLMARHAKIGLEMDLPAPEIPDVILEALGLSKDDLGEILAQGPEFKEKAELFFRGVTV